MWGVKESFALWVSKDIGWKQDGSLDGHLVLSQKATLMFKQSTFRTARLVGCLERFSTRTEGRHLVSLLSHDISFFTCMPKNVKCECDRQVVCNILKFTYWSGTLRLDEAPC